LASLFHGPLETPKLNSFIQQPLPSLPQPTATVDCQQPTQHLESAALLS
jgi:hypothetical protein